VRIGTPWEAFEQGLRPSMGSLCYHAVLGTRPRATKRGFGLLRSPFCGRVKPPTQRPPATGKMGTVQFLSFLLQGFFRLR